MFFFSRKKSFVFFNKKDVSRSHSQNYVCQMVDSKLNFNIHVKKKFLTGNDGIALLRKFSSSFLGKALLLIYQAFLRLHPDYCDVIYFKPLNVLLDLA